jgi:hypothetical protein
MSLTHGQCLCGAIQFDAATPSLWSAHCHCRQCQQQSGAAFVTWLGYTEADCTIEDSSQSLRWFQSSEFAQRGFCQQCGSHLFFKSQREPGELHITATNISTPLDRMPDGHDFWHERVAWLEIQDALPKRDV